MNIIIKQLRHIIKVMVALAEIEACCIRVSQTHSNDRLKPLYLQVVAGLPSGGDLVIVLSSGCDKCLCCGCLP